MIMFCMCGVCACFRFVSPLAGAFSLVPCSGGGCLCAFGTGSDAVGGSAVGFVVGCVGIFGGWSMSRMRGEATLTSVGRCPSEGEPLMPCAQSPLAG